MAYSDSMSADKEFGRDLHTPSTEADQERGLLSDWKDDHGHADPEPKSTKKTSRFGCGMPTIIALLAMLLVLLFIAAAFIFVPKKDTQAVQSLQSVRTNDYILDSNWDFDALPQRREYHWKIQDHVYNPDGIYRPMILANNQFPGPLIECNEGDTIVVHVDNQAVNATSIHWHGIYQNSTPYMDGAIGVSQCPIAPGQQFTYEFTVSGQSQSYFWHAHQGLQSSDGLHGPLIIHSRSEKASQRIPYDSDRVLLISDHYHDLSSALLWQYLKPDMENTEPVPLGGLLNGRSIRSCHEFPDRPCDNTTANVGIPRLDLAPNQRHRLRLINVGAFAEFLVQVDEHELAVVEVDGTEVEPVSYHRISISPAQRYSVIVNTTSTHADTFWLRARMVTTCFTDPPDNLNPDMLAVVRYDSLSQETPTSVDWEEKLFQQCKDMNASDLVPAEAIRPPETPDAFFYLRSNFEIGAMRLARGFWNSSSFRPNARSPSLQRAIDGLAATNESFAAQANQDAAAFVNSEAFDISKELVIQTSGIQTVDILVSNFDDGNHPLHLHGYKYFVLAQGHGYPPLTYTGAEINRENLSLLYDTLDLSNPLRRDTASVEAYGWILIRLVADNPGAWALHCHISWHAEAGLLMQLLTRTDELAKMKIPDSNMALCAATGIEKGMGPEDEAYRDVAK